MTSQRDLTVSNVERAARTLVARKTPHGEAVVELREITLDPVVLGVAAGRALGRWEAIPLFNSLGRDVAALLIRAGADPETMETTADETARRLKAYLKRS